MGAAEAAGRRAGGAAAGDQRLRQAHGPTALLRELMSADGFPDVHTSLVSAVRQPLLRAGGGRAVPRPRNARASRNCCSTSSRRTISCSVLVPGVPIAGRHDDAERLGQRELLAEPPSPALLVDAAVRVGNGVQGRRQTPRVTVDQEIVRNADQRVAVPFRPPLPLGARFPVVVRVPARGEAADARGVSAAGSGRFRSVRRRLRRRAARAR